jgi:hypothetical protein
MGSGDGNPLAEPQQLRKHDCAGDYWHITLSCRNNLGVLWLDCSRGYDRVRELHMTACVANVNNGAELSQALRGVPVPQVRAADLVSKIKQYLCDSAHPGASDTDKVNTLYLMFHSGDPYNA